ncbi:uncharacterized protein VTP21DRAFT_11457 [Calcarisporiella thermophila]|uniref:uncharacterized protein n=1 Tax=Calcarisporiella thermophila TaxID=911321 RepID=UPI003743D59F
MSSSSAIPTQFVTAVSIGAGMGFIVLIISCYLHLRLVKKRQILNSLAARVRTRMQEVQSNREASENEHDKELLPAYGEVNETSGSLSESQVRIISEQVLEELYRLSPPPPAVLNDSEEDEQTVQIDINPPSYAMDDCTKDSEQAGSMYKLLKLFRRIHRR